MAKPKILLIDIETMPTLAYIWDLFTRYVPHSQVAEAGYTACWAAKWLGQKKVHFMSGFHDGQDKMVQGAWDMLNEADIVIHYNGTKFDIPHLNREFLERGMEPPAPFVEIDVLKTCKNRFKLLSNSMAYVAKVVGCAQKGNHKGMDLWTECRHGIEKSWKDMKAYNIQDVKVLEEIYMIMRPWIQPHPNLALFNDETDPQCGVCGSKDVYIHPKIHVTQTMRYKRIKCRDCGKWSRTRTNDLSKEKRRNVLVGIK